MKPFLRSFGFKKLFWCFLLLAVVMAVVVALFPNNDAAPINNEHSQPFNEGWFLENTGEAITLPYLLHTAANETVTISRVLPDVFQQSNPTLSFHSSLQTVRVEAGGRVLYEYCQEPDAYFDVPPPPAWHVIRLSPDLVGETLQITYSAPYAHYAGVLNDIEIGTKFANVADFVGNRIISIALCFIIFTFGLFAIVICLFAHNIIADLNRLLYLGIASLLIALWSACETKALQILIGNVQLIMFITFLSFMLFPIALLLFFRESFSGRVRTLYNVMLGVFSLYFAANFLLQAFNVITFNDFFILFLLLGGIMLALILATLVAAYLKKKTEQTRLPMVAVFFLLIFAMVDMYRYFIGKLVLTSYSDTSLFIRVGILTMIFILGYSSIRQILVYYSESTKAEVYKALSQTDSLSGLKNRAYLSEVCPMVLQDAMKHARPISIIMIDIDNFKSYNDQFGHSAGDEVIRAVSDVLKEEAESLLGTAIRYGGEEFLLLLPQMGEAEAVATAERMKAGIQARGIPYGDTAMGTTVTVSQGIYSVVPQQGDTLEQFINLSDQAMYQVKKNSKNGYAVYREECESGAARQ